MIYLLVYLLTRNKALVIIFTSVVNHGVTPLLPMHIEWTHLPLVQDMTRYQGLFLHRTEKLCWHTAS